MSHTVRLIAFGLFLALVASLPAQDVFAPEAVHPPRTIAGKESVLIFVGDIMLGRFVETLSREAGFDYPFRGVTEFFKTGDLVFGNFEGAVPEEPWQTPLGSFRLAFPEEAVLALNLAHVTVVSLANNHATDFGEYGYLHTRELLAGLGVQSFGHPRALDERSLTRVSLGSRNVQFLGLNETFGPHATSEIALLLAPLSQAEKDFLVVSVHWGDEYEAHSNSTQRELAHFLIDSGADLVVGHHPHVSQEIEKYKGKLIFYSLGNFIFDQYFSEETKTGLAVRLSLSREGERYELVPIYGARSNPSLLEGEAKDGVLRALASRSSSDISKDIARGFLLVK